MYASRIWPTSVAGAPFPIFTPTESALITRVNASTPGVNAASGWPKQIELTPSEPQAIADEALEIGPRELGVRLVPGTLIHTFSDCWTTCSISFSFPAGE